MPSGSDLVVIWIELLILAGKINDSGSIYFSQELPYTDQLLSAQFGFPVSTIQFALATFSKFGMIEIVDDIIKISNWKKYQNDNALQRIRSQNAERQRNYYYRQKALTSGEPNVRSNVSDNVKSDEKCSIYISNISSLSKGDIEDKDMGCGEKGKKPKRERKAFVKPTVEEVSAYCQERKNDIDPEAFIAHYESNGWMVGKNPMQNWKMAVVTWEKNHLGGRNVNKNNNTNSKSPYKPDGTYDYEAGLSSEWESL